MSTAETTLFNRVLSLNRSSFLITNPDFIITDCPVTIKEILGLERRKLINKSLFDLIADGQKNSLKSKITRLNKSTKTTEFKCELLTTQKRKISVLCSVVLLSKSKKNTKYLFAFRDETPHINKLEQYEREHNFFKVLMNNVPDTIYFKDRQSRFTMINEAQAKLLGINNPADAIGKTDFDFFTKEHAEAAYADEQEIIKTGKPLIYKVEKVRRGSDKKFIWVSATKVPVFDKSGNVKGIVGISRDITHFKEAEDQLKSLTEELKELNETKDRLFSIIAHDLRNPFISLLGISNIILEEYNDLSEDEKLEYLTEIETSAKSAYDLLENLLYWSRTQTNNISYSPQKFNLSDVISRNIRLLSFAASSKKINLINNAENNLWAYGDPDLVDIIVRNFISNAVKFTPEGGKVEVVTKILNDEIKVIVEDSGIGMSKEKIEGLLKYNKVESSLGTNKEKGTGLGLLLCKDFIEMNNGKMEIDSYPGQGTRISFTIKVGNEGLGVRG
ncbi:PAS domain S-box protein [Melioribacter sp. OK-6-Me]|uniref:sensor histidine kinase n=1 Tax=Melioribacter sp. OK-6-Me TaxID=3423433 RepID=UPI003ED86AA1